MTINYALKLAPFKVFNSQRTFERYGYHYPARAKDKISLSCLCGREGQLSVNDFFTRIKKKGEYTCASCGALAREYTIDWKTRLSGVDEYAKETTIETFGYEYPKRSTDLVCRRCSCGKIVKQEAGEFWRYCNKDYKCKLCAAKDGFTLRKEKMFQARDEFWSKDENRQWASDLAKSREQHIIRNEAFEKARKKGYEAKLPEIKKKQSEASKRLWAEQHDVMQAHAKATGPARAEKLKENMKDPLVRSYYSQKGKENWESPEYRAKQKEAWTSERKQKLIARNKSPEMLAKLNCIRNSSEEFLLRYFFESLDVKCVPDYVIGHYVVDIFLPSLSLLIEFDGLRWHHPDYSVNVGNSKLGHDRAKTTYIKKYHPELTLFRLNETSLYQKGFLEQTFQHLLEEKVFSFAEVDLREVDNTEALKFLTLFHYKENQKAAPGLKVGAYLDNKLIGIAVYSSVGRREMATSMGYKPKEVVELSRFCIHPCHHKNNFGSWLLARSREYVRKKYPYLLGIITFADSTLDHQGTIYKAAGYSLVSEVPEDYHYRHKETGRFMHKRTLWGLAKKMRESESIFYLKHGFEKVWGAKKFKFFYSYPL
jgi:hypothetical protein